MSAQRKSHARESFAALTLCGADPNAVDYSIVPTPASILPGVSCRRCVARLRVLAVRLPPPKLRLVR